MFRSITSAALLVSVLLFSSCTRQDILTEEDNLLGTWAITGITSDQAYDWDGDGRRETDIYRTYTVCERDIVLIFDRNGYGEIREGCDQNFVDMEWDYSGSRLDLYIPSGNMNLDLIQSDSRTIRGVDRVQVNGNTFMVTYTLTRR